MRPARAASFVGLALVAFSARDANAYRPFDGTDADVAALGEFELELGPIGYLRASDASAIVAPNAVLNLGVLPRWELVVQGVGEIPFSGALASYGNGGVFLKHVLREGALQGKSGLSIATEFGVLLPEYVDDRWSDAGVYLGLIASKAWRDFVVHLNASIARSVDARGDFFAGAIVEALPRARIRPVAELYVDFHGAMTTPSALVGFVLRANARFAFDAATRLAWTNDAPAFEIRAGLTWTVAM